MLLILFQPSCIKAAKLNFYSAKIMMKLQYVNYLTSIMLALCWFLLWRAITTSDVSLLISVRRLTWLTMHEILLKKLSTLGLNNSIFNWIANFLNGRSQAVKMGDIISARSIVQGSGLGTYLFILLARKLRTLSLINRLCQICWRHDTCSPATHGLFD